VVKSSILGTVYLCDGFYSGGPVAFDGTSVGGNFDCRTISGGQFVLGSVLNTNLYALSLANGDIGGDFFKDNGFKVDGGIKMDVASVRGEMVFGRGVLEGREYSIIASNAKFGKNVGFLDGCRVSGSREFAHSAFGRSFACQDCSLKIAEATAAHLYRSHPLLDMTKCDLNGNVILGNGFVCNGEVCLRGATISGGLDCRAAQLLNRGGNALFGERLHVKGDVFLWNRLKTVGLVDLRYAQIGGVLQLYNLVDPQEMKLDLTSAKVGPLYDSAGDWPNAGNLVLDNFVYDSLEPSAPADAYSRVKWLRLSSNSTFNPQPYEQLAGVLRKEGHDIDADNILIEKDDVYSKHLKNCFRRLWWWFLGVCSDYGYRPWYALVWTASFVVVGWKIFKFAYKGGHIVHSEKSDAKFWPMIFSVETFVPFLQLAFEDDWKVIGSDRPAWWLSFYLYFHRCVGFSYAASGCAS